LHGLYGLQVRIPARIADAWTQDCTRRRPAQTAACQPRLAATNATVRIPTTAAGYPRPYYLVTGWPTLFGFSPAIWYVMRLCSVALCVGLVGLGLWSLNQLDVRFAAVGVILCVMPAGASVIGVVNPSGPEICAAIAIGLAAVAYYRCVSPPEPTSRVRPLVALSVATAYLSIARPSTFLLAAGVAGLYALLGGRTLFRRARRYPRQAVSDLAVILLPALAVTKLLGATPRSNPSMRPASWLRVLGSYVLPSLWSHFRESTMRVTDTEFGWLTTFVWFVALSTVVVLALRVGSGFQRVMVLAGIGAATIVGPAFVYHSVFPNGSGYQARYALTLFSTAIVIACAVLHRRRPAFASSPGAAVLIGLSALLNLCALVGAFTRYSHSLPGPRTLLGVLLDHSWAPPGWPALVAAVVVFCLSTLLLMSPPVHVAEAVDPVGREKGLWSALARHR
jgi:hypothetical protein